MSRMPSWLKSAATTLPGDAVTEIVIETKPLTAVGRRTESQAEFEAGDPGLETVTSAVVAEEMSEAETVACNCLLETKVVERGLPFQLTTEVETNPFPFTVSVKSPPPGATLAGTSG